MSPVRVYLLHQEDLRPPSPDSYPHGPSPDISVRPRTLHSHPPPAPQLEGGSTGPPWGSPGSTRSPAGTEAGDCGQLAQPREPGTSGRAAPTATTTRVQLQPGVPFLCLARRGRDPRRLGGHSPYYRWRRCFGQSLV